MADCPFNSADENIADFIYRIGSQQQIIGNPADIPCMDYVNDEYNIIYTPLDTVTPISLARYSYYTVPGLFSLLDSSSMEASGILTTFAAPALGNRGRGTLIGIVDTGIDYTNPLFRYSDGSTRIVGLWDQSIPAGADAVPSGVPAYYELSGASYGTEFTREQINEALASDSPLDLVPSTDTNGHGTFLAGIAAGTSLPEQDFTGAAPECELVVVKLKQAKRYLRDFYLVSQEADAYQENDIMMGIKYLRVAAFRLSRPLIILIALGSNLGSHEGTSPLSGVVQDASRFLGRAAVIAAGNETGRAHHSRIPIIARNETSIPFLLEPTVITVNYQLIETGAGKQLIFMRFKNPVAGIWKVRVYNTQYFTGEFHMWLPSEGLISDETVFLRPTPDTTITLPGNTAAPITVGAYNHLNNSIYIHSSRGFTPSGIVKPELAAPGVNVMGPSLGRRGNGSVPMTTRSGTSVAAAHVAGAVASLYSWGIVEGNQITMSQASVKSYLIRGAKRNPALRYPNEEWGYGALDLYETFRRIWE